MAEILAPESQAVYAGYVPSVRKDANDFLRSIPQPQLDSQNTAPQPPNNGAAASPSGGGGETWGGLVSNLEKGKGQRLSPEELDTAAQRFKTETYARYLYSQPRATAGSVKAGLAAFDSQYARFRDNYNGAGKQDAAGSTGPAGLPSDEDSPWYPRELLAQLIGGAAKIVPGTLGLVDNAIRGTVGAARNVGKIYDGLASGDTGAASAAFNAPIEFSDRTALGDAAAGMDRGINEAVESNKSNDTKRQEFEIAKSLEQDDSIENTMAQYLKNPRVLTSMAAGGAGSLLPVGAASKINKVSTFLKGLGATERTAVLATAAGAPLSSSISFEEKIDSTPLAELLGNDKFKTVYASAKAANMDDGAAEKYLKNYVKNSGAPAAVLANLAGNVGLAAIPGLGGAEAAIGRGVAGTAGKLATRVGKAAVSEGAQEGGAGYLQTVGENTGLGKEDVTEGAGANAAINALVGAMVGGPVAAVSGNTGNKLKRKTGNRTPTNAPDAGTGDTATDTSVTPTPGAAASSAPPAQGIDDEAFIVPQQSLQVALNKLPKNSGRLKQANNATDAESFLSAASALARINTGDVWATLDAKQRIQLVEDTVDILQKKNPREIEGLGEAITQAKLAANPVQPTNPAAAPDAAVTEQPIPNDILTGDPATVRTNVQDIVDTDQSVEDIRNKLKTKAKNPKPAKAAPKDTELEDALKGAAAAMGDNFVAGAIARAAGTGGSSTVETEPFYKDFKAAYDAGQITDVASGRAFIESWKPKNTLAGKKPTRSSGVKIDPAKATAPATPTVEATPSPKTEAPAQDVAGAQNLNPEPQVTAEPESPLPVTNSESANPSDLDTQLRGIIGEDVLDADLTEVSTAARGEPSSLNAKLKELQDNEYITKEQAKAVRETAKAYNDSQKAQTVAAEDDGALEDAVKEARANEDTNDISDYEDIRSSEPQHTAHESRLADIKKIIADFRAKVTAGSLTMQEAIAEAKKWMDLRDIYIHGPQRGIDAVRAKIVELRNNANPRAKRAADFAEWLLDQNPNLATDLAVSLENWDSRTGAGVYDSLGMFVRLGTNTLNANTFTHEILHHSERMLPPDIQDALRSEYLGRLFNKRKQAERTGNKAAMEYIDKVYEFLANPTKTTKAAIIQHLVDNIEALPANEYYKYSNQSEYWAEEATRILSERHAADSWQAKAKVWLSEFFSKLKDFLNLPSDAAVYKGLDSVLESDGSFQSDRMLNMTTAPVQSVVDPSDEMRNSKVTGAQWIGEVFTNSAYALEKSVQDTLASNGTVTADTNPMVASYRYNNDVNYYNNKDSREVHEPVVKWIETNWQNYDVNDASDFVDKANTYFQNKNFLERIKSDWLENVPLNNETEVDRDNIIEDMKDGVTTPSAARAALTKLVNANAAQNVEAYYEAKRSKKGIKYGTLQTKLEELDLLHGLNDNSMEEVNTLLDPVRKRNTERLVEAGFFAANDPWNDFRGWKYYVPLKGQAYKTDEVESFDLPIQNPSIASLSKQIATMEGRDTLAERPFTRLFVDTLRAGERAANAKFNNSIYEYILDNQELFGATVTVYEGGPKDGYTNEDDTEFATIPRKGNELIINDGTQHYVVAMDEKSQLLRGLKTRLNVVNINKSDNPLVKGLRGIRTGTNILARLYTTASPEWQTAVGFVRDLSQVPVTLAVTEFDNPLEAGRFAAGYGKNVLQSYRALPTLWEALKGDQNAIEKMAEEDPDSYADWLVRFEANGGSNNFTEGFDIGGMDGILAGGKVDGEGILTVPKSAYNTVLKYTGNYANFLEKLGRVAAFKTLVEGGMTEKEAAIKVRMTLDYSQTGTWGRAINSWLAFYRVGATSADVMRRAFTKPLGGLNYSKMAKWGGMFSAFGAIGYMMQAALLGASDDEDKKDRIKKMRISTLTNKVLVPVGDQVIGINIGLGLPQLLMAPGIVAAAVENNHITYEQGVAELYDVFTRNASPIRPAGRKDGSGISGLLNSWMQGLAPTVLAPITNVASNTDAFGRDINLSDYDKGGKFRSEQARSSTPKEYTDMARWVRSLTGDKVDFYPEDIKYLINSYSGQLGSSLTKEVFGKKSQEEAGVEVSPVRVGGKFLVEDEKYYYENAMYDTLDALSISNKRYEAAKTKGGDSEAAKLLSTNPKLAAQQQAYAALDKYRKRHSKEVKAIRNDGLMSPERKRLKRKEIDSNLRRQVDAARKLI